MKDTFKLLRRFFLVLILSIFLLLILNLILLFLLSYRKVGNGSPWETAQEISDALVQTEDGKYHLSEEGQAVLSQSGAWAILIDNKSGRVEWNSDNLPQEVPKQYSLADLSYAIRGYIADYPTTTGEHGEDLLILGNPKNSLWKAMWNTFDYDMIAHLPQNSLLLLCFNLVFIFLIYMVVVSGFLRSVKPIIAGVEALPEGRDVYVKEKGLLSSLAASLNRASEKLRMQEYRLRKKETARANWIAGVSHDIRTPLSMVMGYAGQLEEDKDLPEDTRKKAGVIRLQSVRMKNLINDLNLSSKLEYNAQPLHKASINAVALLRGIAVDFLNLDAQGHYPIKWATEEDLTSCIVEADANLLKRAISNLIVNAQVHNPDGCIITVNVREEQKMCRITISDDGIGVTDQQLESILSAPHYMVCDSNTREQRHGLGLLIVRQIAAAHHGTVEIGRSVSGGLEVSILLPQKEEGVSSDRDC